MVVGLLTYTFDLKKRQNVEKFKKLGYVSCLPVKAQQQKWRQIQSARNLFLKLCSAAHFGSNDNSQNWSTKVCANIPTTIQALKNEIGRSIAEIQRQLCQTEIKNFVIRTQVSQQCRGGHLPDVLFHT